MNAYVAYASCQLLVVLAGNCLHVQEHVSHNNFERQWCKDCDYLCCWRFLCSLRAVVISNPQYY